MLDTNIVSHFMIGWKGDEAMETMTISEVTKVFSVSARMIRYYEKMGLIQSSHQEDYAYRVYDKTAIYRVQLILILRKLRIPLKQIEAILNDTNQMKTLRILQENMSEIKEEIAALNIIKSILEILVSQLEDGIKKNIRIDLLEEKKLTDIAKMLILPKINLKEDLSMDHLVAAKKVLDLKADIRIVYLPPSVVASSHYFGENPEDNAGNQLEDFIKKVRLPELKPDFRVYGFNNPSPEDEKQQYGYEFWVTIPEDFSVPKPLIRREFAGGLYAAHCIKMGDFQEWGTFFEQMQNSIEYDIDWREPEGMGGSLEEHLNAFSYYNGTEESYVQLDLLIPIKKKS